MYTQFVLRDAGDRLTKGNKNVYFYEQDFSSILLYNVDISSQLNGYKRKQQKASQSLNPFLAVAHSSEIPYVWMPDQIWENAIENNLVS